MRKAKLKIEPEIGKKIGRLTIIDFCILSENKVKPTRGVICRCDCGKMKIASYYSVKNQSTSSCGCLYSPDLSGKSFGYFIALCRDPNNSYNYFCKCKCGVVKSVPYSHLKTGRIVSCGCKRGRCNGLSKTKVYRAWTAIRQRCYNPNNISYPNYGAKGVVVCDRWLQSFNNFFEDVGLPPTNQHSLDRYPNTSGNYEPTNFRWATDTEQAQNRTTNKFVDYNGETLCLYEAARKYGVVEPGVFVRRLRLGWGIEKALKTPKLKNK